MSAISAIFDFLAQWASAFWLTLRETGAWLVIGLVLAGVLHVFVPARIILWALGHGGWRGALRGALIGAPLPLSSCGAIPAALKLRRQGASLSATTAFTISTPETSIDAIALTVALLPTVFLGVRPVTAVLLAFIVGIVVELFSRTTREELRLNILKLSRADDPGGAHSKESELCKVCGLMTEEEHAHGAVAKVGSVLSYAFGAFFNGIATWLVFGLVAAALIQVAVPENIFNDGWLARNPTIQILLALAAGMPFYTCAIATTPMVAALLAKGLNPGAALALMLAGPGISLANMIAFKREFGGRIAFVYYAALFLLCFMFSLALSFAWPHFERVTVLSQLPSIDLPGWVEVLAAWLLAILTLKIWASAFFARVSGRA